MIASRAHEIRSLPSSSHCGDCRGDLAPSVPSGSPSTSSNKWGPRRLGSNVKPDDSACAVSSAVKADGGAASEARGEDSTL
ncbi:hypothetical protein JG687_00013309 [Phytophthora cactorum]|uniref:Uncharacterized protein n=1 Tax=Phytophthora cactorum TaxID=29920 RepID=A0A8T1U300_9STRA|nr:hypothetical protein JG687_00013309 [Phytophthora cactorum]